MRLFGKEITSIKPEDIYYLRDNKISESITLDYKRELPGNTDQDKKEFLADVSSFANTIGGVIIFGIEEEKDENGKNTGFPATICGLSNVNIDQEKLRLESILKDGLDPRLGRIDIRVLDVDSLSVLLLGIPRSLLSPHLIAFKKDGKFYSRNNSGKFQLDVNQIRDAFLQTSEWEKSAEKFRRSRIVDVRNLQYIPNLITDNSIFLHVLPLGFDRLQIPLEVNAEKLRSLLSPPGHSGWDTRFNLDGFLAYRSNSFESKTKCEGYVQYFRNGGMEVYSSCYIFNNEGQTKTVNVQAIERMVVTYSSNFLNFTPTLDIEPPFIVYLSLCDTKNANIFTKEYRSRLDPNSFDRDEILLPGVIVEDIDSVTPQTFKQTFDMLWQCAGWKGSPSYIVDNLQPQ
jgi:hypothetical protein